MDINNCKNHEGEQLKMKERSAMQEAAELGQGMVSPRKIFERLDDARGIWFFPGEELAYVWGIPSSDDVQVFEVTDTDFDQIDALTIKRRRPGIRIFRGDAFRRVKKDLRERRGKEVR